MYRRLSFFAVLLAVFISSGCSSDSDVRRQEYLDADYYTRLELPPDLTAPEDVKQLTAPKPTDAAIGKFRRDSDEIGKTDAAKAEVVKNIAGEPVVPVALQAKSARLKSEEGIFWLEVDENADKLWSQLSGFWSHEGIRIVRNEPVLGVVETDWVSKLQVDDSAGFLSQIFNNVEPDKLDKFRMRIEPEETDRTRIFLSHSGLEVSVEGEDVNWRTRCSEEELEREMLNRLALYVGMDEQQAEKAFENYRPYASRVKVPQDEVNVLYVTGTMNFVWKRSLRALDRLGVAVLEMDSNTHQIKLAIEPLSREQLGKEKDEIAESSWLMRWLTDADEPGSSDESRQFNLRLEQQNGVVRVALLKPDGEPATTVQAEQFRKALAIELQ